MGSASQTIVSDGHRTVFSDGSNGEIFIVDDDPVIRDSLSMTFTLAGYRVRTFVDGISFIAAARARTPACALLDVYMPGKSGLDILKEIDARNYGAPIFILSGRSDIPTAIAAIRNGAFDFIEKRDDIGTIVARVGQAIEAYARRREPSLSLSFPGCEQLTPREHVVLAQITAGVRNREAAKTLGISQRTVEVHRAHIMLKLGAKNTVDLVRKVLSRGNGLAP